MSKFEIKNIRSHSKDLEVLFDDIEELLKNIEGFEQVRDFLEERTVKIKNNELQGIVLFDNLIPKGFAWIELVSECYGNIITHALEEVYQKPLMEALIRSNLLENTLFEQIQFEATEIYRDTLKENHFIQIQRDRMYFDLSKDLEISNEKDNISFIDWTEDKLELTGELSFLAHKQEQSQVCYRDLDSAKRRVNLEKLLFEGGRGKVVFPACQLICLDQKIVGCCTVVETQCWGYDAVPWIFDISIHPDYIGHGLGRLLLNKVNSILKDKNYPIVGLAVTSHNKRAKSLYLSYGFKEVETFYEFGTKNTYN